MDAARDLAAELAEEAETMEFEALEVVLANQETQSETGAIPKRPRSKPRREGSSSSLASNPTSNPRSEKSSFFSWINNFRFLVAC